MNHVSKGHFYENTAAAYLSRNGYRILERNYRCRFGEIDIIAEDGPYLVFIEVKYRKNADVQHPLEAVDNKKQQRIIQTARYYLYTRGGLENRCCRFDVIAVMGCRIWHCKDAFNDFFGKGW